MGDHFVLGFAAGEKAAKRVENEFIPGLNIFHYFYTHIIQLFVYELLFGVVVGGLSSFWAVRRYLKN